MSITRWVTKCRSINDNRVVCLSLSQWGNALALQIEQRACHVDATLTEFAYCRRMRTSVP